jgi:mono/diheme cytochrome c family protein
MATNDTSGNGLLRWLIGGLLVGAAVLGLMVASYAVGYNRGEDKAASAVPPPPATTETTTTETTTTETTEPTTTGETTTTETTEPTTTGETDLTAQGAEVFASAGCGGCHVLADAGASGTVGPDLDQVKPSEELVSDRVTNGLGAMPSFEGQLSEEEIQAVSVYVSQVAGK